REWLVAPASRLKKEVGSVQVPLWLNLFGSEFSPLTVGTAEEVRQSLARLALPQTRYESDRSRPYKDQGPWLRHRRRRRRRGRGWGWWGWVFQGLGGFGNAPVGDWRTRQTTNGKRDEPARRRAAGWKPASARRCGT